MVIVMFARFGSLVMVRLRRMKFWFLYVPFASVEEVKESVGERLSIMIVRVSEVLMLFALSVTVTL